MHDLNKYVNKSSLAFQASTVKMCYSTKVEDGVENHLKEKLF